VCVSTVAVLAHASRACAGLPTPETATCSGGPRAWCAVCDMPLFNPCSTVPAHAQACQRCAAGTTGSAAGRTTLRLQAAAAAAPTSSMHHARTAHRWSCACSAERPQRTVWRSSVTAGCVHEYGTIAQAAVRAPMASSAPDGAMDGFPSTVADFSRAPGRLSLVEHTTMLSTGSAG
jgi:hypothetical protein